MGIKFPKLSAIVSFFFAAWGVAGPLFILSISHRFLKSGEKNFL